MKVVRTSSNPLTAPPRTLAMPQDTHPFVIREMADEQCVIATCQGRGVPYVRTPGLPHRFTGTKIMFIFLCLAHPAAWVFTGRPRPSAALLAAASRFPFHHQCITNKYVLPHEYAVSCAPDV